MPIKIDSASRKLHLGRVRGLSRKTIEVPRASKKQSPPVRGIGSAIPSTLSQQLPRESMAKCAKSVGDIFLSEGVTFSPVWFSCFMPHGAVASSLCRPKAVTCIVLKMSVIESNLASLFWTNRQNIRTPEQFSSTTKELYSTVPNVTHLSKGVIMGKLEGKVAVITGGSSGIGLATAKRFVEEGAHVVITGRREKELKEAAAVIKRNVTTFVGDVSLLEDLDRLYAVVKEKHGHIDILFANAGAGTVAPLAMVTEAHFDQTFDVNVKGLFFTVQKALPLFKDGGSIILNSSVSNVMGLPGFSTYAASKAAVRSFARGWTMDLKDRKIRVNSMSPGPIETPALEKVGLPPEQVEQAIAGFTSQVPLGRRGKPEEIAAAVVVLASDESSYITGVDLAVDGGMAQV